MSAASAGLLLVEQGGGGRELAVPASGQVVVGSDPRRAALLFQAEGVAGEHVRVGRLRRGGWALRALAPGVRLNGDEVEQARLAHGDRVELGSATLLVIDRTLEPLEPEATPAPAEEIALPAPKDETDGAVPERIGGYRVVRALGRGAFGHVLLAIQESLERETALKLLSPRVAHDREFVRRFQEEARAAASLSHPNVVVVYDVGEADGHHFLSMEYMARGSLEDRLAREGRLPWREALEVLLDAARGLEYAEQRGIVHRDIKPANLMQAENGVTKIADLGLAVSIDAARGDAVGTAHFASPEQARGEAVDHRSDLYSLGATAFRLLTGRTPFAGTTKREILAAVFDREPPAVDTLVPEVPAELSALVGRLLAKAPEERPQSARELTFLLEHLRVRGAAAPARSTSSLGGRLVAAAGAVAVLGLALVALLYGLGTDEEPEERPMAEDAITRVPRFEEPTRTPRSEPREDRRDTRGMELPADDEALTELEERANERFARLPPPEATAARAAALRELVAGFGGTTAAAVAARELDQLETRRAGQATLESARDRERRSALDALRAGLALERPDFRPLPALERLREFEPPLALLGDAELATGVDGLRSEVLDRALRSSQEALDRANAAAARGDFEEARTVLVDARERLGVSPPSPSVPRDRPSTEPRGPRPGERGLDPELSESASAPEGTPVVGLGVASRGSREPARDELDPEARRLLTAADERLRERAAALDLERLEFASARARADLAAMTESFWSDGAFERELRALDFDAAGARLARLAESLATDEHRARVRALAGGLEAYRRALDALAEAHASEAWRRHSVLAPGADRAETRQVVGTAPGGLLLEATGRPERVAWSEFADSTALLDGLFNGRLTRDYSPAELEGIAFGVRLAAVLEALEGLAPAFEREPPSLTQGESAALARAFERASEWAARTGSVVAVREEAAAVARVTTALIESGRGAWTAATKELEAADDEAEGSLFLLLAGWR